VSIHHLTTEQRNANSSTIDMLTAIEIVELINREDSKVASAVAEETESIGKAVELIADCFRAGGRLFYLGAGTSGRLGVLDASECPPTFSTPPAMVVGIIAGGEQALTRAIEGAEDSLTQAALDLQTHTFCQQDVLVGIATSGRTPYVLGGLQYARSLGAKTIGYSCNRPSELDALSDVSIATIVGPEVISGSTRMKSGTATKMVLNTLTTAAMILIGKTYGNLMVDLRASNSKLKARSIRIVAEIAELSSSDAERCLASCNGEVKTGIVSSLLGISAEDARRLLTQNGGQLRATLHSREPHA
jgi:N-acetylmuramic acid 6-phosphate etherase